MDKDIRRAAYSVMSVNILCTAIILAALGEFEASLLTWVFSLVPLSASYAVRRDGISRMLWKRVGMYE